MAQPRSFQIRVTLLAQCALLVHLVPSIGFAQEVMKSPQMGEAVSLFHKVPSIDGEFRKSWPPGFQGIGCDMGKAPKNLSGYTYCLRLGSLNLGMEFSHLQTALSSIQGIPEKNIVNPHLVSISEDSVRTLLIPISATPSNDQIRLLSYLIVLIDNSNVVRSLQLTGQPSEMTNSLAFSSIMLGTTTEKVTDILGLPSSVADVPEISGKVWNYAPFPFSIEFVNGSVYSIRIDSPTEESLRKAFVPLNSVGDMGKL